MPRSLRLSALATALLLAATAARAEPAQTIGTDLSGTLREVTALSSLGTADALTGALGLAFFQDGSSAQAAFIVTSSGFEQVAVAQTAAFAIVATSEALGDGSRPDEWQVINLDASRTLVGFSIDGRGTGAGRAAFDTYFGPQLNDEGTPGSGSGISLFLDYSNASFLQGTVTTTYRQPVALAGTPAVGDLFARVDVALAITTANLGGLPPATQFGGAFSQIKFTSDLDTVTYAAPVPEPTSAALLGAGLLALAGAATRRVAARARDIADSLR